MNQLIDCQELVRLLLPLQGAACFMDIDYIVMKTDESPSGYTSQNRYILLHWNDTHGYCYSTVCECAERKRDKEQKPVLTLISIGPLSDGCRI